MHYIGWKITILDRFQALIIQCVGENLAAMRAVGNTNLSALSGLASMLKALSEYFKSLGKNPYERFEEDDQSSFEELYQSMFLDPYLESIRNCYAPIFEEASGVLSAIEYLERVCLPRPNGLSQIS